MTVEQEQTSSGERRVCRKRSTSILSPLRYPGSKRRLCGYVEQVLAVNGLNPSLFVELFAGGASISLQLLNDGLVESVGLVERDPIIAAFWKTVFYDTEWLIQAIEEVEVSLRQWEEFREDKGSSRREMALACLFLNRTSFSGILAESAGPIGGKKQESDYTIDCRFTKSTIIRRIRQAASLAPNVKFVWNYHWAVAVGRLRKMRERGSVEELFFYLDPPFFEKAEKLYRFYFDDDDHVALCDALVKFNDPWLLSYDPAERLTELYSGKEWNEVDLLYSTSNSSNGPQSTSEVVLSNLPNKPSDARAWRTKEEWDQLKQDSAAAE